MRSDGSSTVSTATVGVVDVDADVTIVTSDASKTGSSSNTSTTICSTLLTRDRVMRLRVLNRLCRRRD